MKKLEYNKIFFDSAFSEARMNPYFDRYPGNEKKAIRHYEQNIRKRPARHISVSIGTWCNFAQFGGVCQVL